MDKSQKNVRQGQKRGRGESRMHMGQSESRKESTERGIEDVGG